MRQMIPATVPQREATTRSVSTETHFAEPVLVDRSSFEGAMRYAVQRCELDQYEIADEMGCSHGQMSKVMKGTGGFYGHRFVEFMKTTKSLAPLQWYAAQMGCVVVPRQMLGQ